MPPMRPWSASCRRSTARSCREVVIHATGQTAAVGATFVAVQRMAGHRIVAVSLVKLGDQLEEFEYYQQQLRTAEAAPPQPQAQ